MWESRVSRSVCRWACHCFPGEKTGGIRRHFPGRRHRQRGRRVRSNRALLSRAFPASNPHDHAAIPVFRHAQRREVGHVTDDTRGCAAGQARGSRRNCFELRDGWRDCLFMTAAWNANVCVRCGFARVFLRATYRHASYLSRAKCLYFRVIPSACVNLCTFAGNRTFDRGRMHARNTGKHYGAAT